MARHSWRNSTTWPGLRYVYDDGMTTAHGHPAHPFAPDALARLRARELEHFRLRHPRSAAEAARATHWFTGTPLHWMRDWSLPFPPVIAEASGARLVDVDGQRYVDFCLGDTAAMFGHAPAPLVEALGAQLGRGLTTMLPSAAAAEVASLLADRFGLPQWQVATTASDANRFLLRWARAATGRPVVVVFDGCYHGAVDDTQVVLAPEGTRPAPGLLGQVFDPAQTTRVVPFNDLEALERALAPGDVAAVLCEPALTNCGLVLPDEGFLPALRALTTRHGTLWLADETHSLSAGPGGYCSAHGLAPDAVVVGKAIAGGLACAVYGVSGAFAQAMQAAWDAAAPGRTGIGTTLSGNALQLAALEASLRHLLVPETFARMQRLSNRYVARMEQVLERHRLRWRVTQLGARCELQFTARQPRTAAEAAASFDHALESLLHLYLLNRGVLVTPFHNMVLMSPATSLDEVEVLVDATDACFAELSEPAYYQESPFRSPA